MLLSAIGLSATLIALTLGTAYAVFSIGRTPSERTVSIVCVTLLAAIICGCVYTSLTTLENNLATISRI